MHYIFRISILLWIPFCCHGLSTPQSRPHLVFPGGGIYFYHQAGVVEALRERRIDIKDCVGASAGALAATLAVCEVDFYEATRLALSLAEEAGVWERKGGLQGVWGRTIREWLNTLLPEDAHEIANQRKLSILVSPFPNVVQKERITEFCSKQDLIDCNMASVHLPWFLDGKLVTEFRGRPFIDGSFLAQPKDYIGTHERVITLSHKKDPKYREANLLKAVEAVSPDGIYQMLEDGKRFAMELEERGVFAELDRI